MKPKTRSEIKFELRDELCKIVDKILDDVIVTSCINCLHFSEGEDVCKLYKARPPARVIATACPKWEDCKIVPY